MCKEIMKKITPKAVVDELAAIGFASATNFLRVSGGELTIRETDSLSKADQAAIASIERSSTGIKLKFYDKMKALELLGKYMGMFEGTAREEEAHNNLLEAILAATQEEVDMGDISEIQQTTDHCHDLVEPTGS
jgi:phage terminase small subunit